MQRPFTQAPPYCGQAVRHAAIPHALVSLSASRGAATACVAPNPIAPATASPNAARFHPAMIVFMRALP
jgi:hypothetical protein